MKFFILLFFFTSSLLRADSPPPYEFPKEVVAQSTTESDTPQSHWTAHHGGGSAVATLLTANKKGNILRTWELNLRVGLFPDNLKYQGTPLQASLSYDGSDGERTKHLLEQIKTLDPNKSYVFTYLRKHPFNIEIEDSRYQIVHILEMQPELLKFIPTKYTVKSQVGEYLFRAGQKTGKIMNVYRFGTLFSVTCLVSFNLGGTKPKPKDEDDNESFAKTMDVVVESEKGCRHAEKLLLTGATVKFYYTEAHTLNTSTWMQFSEYQVHTFEVVEDTQKYSEADVSKFLEVLGVKPGADKAAIQQALDDYISNIIDERERALSTHPQ